jgi:hypothetical protein
VYVVTSGKIGISGLSGKTGISGLTKLQFVFHLTFYSTTPNLILFFPWENAIQKKSISQTPLQLGLAEPNLIYKTIAYFQIWFSLPVSSLLYTSLLFCLPRTTT